jgi:hypothetical protein
MLLWPLVVVLPSEVIEGCAVVTGTTPGCT